MTVGKFPVSESDNGAVETLLGTMDADTGDMVTSLQLIDDAVATTGSAITTKGLAAAGTDGTNARILKLDSDGHVQTDVLSSALPSGASTEATQADVKTAVQLIDDGIATIGAAVPAKGMAAVGSDGTNARLLRTDSDGHVQVDVLSGGGTVGGALEATQGDVKTAVQLLDDAVATLGSASPAKSLQVTRPDPTYVQLDVDRSTNHADLPGTATGPAGTAIPAWARKAIFQAYLTAGGGGVTVPVTIYLRRKNTEIAAGGSRWIAWAAHTNIDTETAIADTWNLAVDDPELYDMIAAYIAGSAGVFEVQTGVAFAA